MTHKEIIAMIIETEQGTFTPQYTFDDYNQETDEYTNLEIIKTAQEVYQEWLTKKDKQIDICTPKTNQELQEEIENLKAQLGTVHERLCTQQEMSSTVIAHVFGTEVLKNE